MASAIGLADDGGVLDPVADRSVDVTEVAGLRASIFTGLGGSYSGIALFGMAGGLLAPALGAVLLGPPRV